MSEIINKDDARIKAFMASIESMLTSMEQITDNYRPPLNGARFMTDSELSKQLHVSRRTLQEWRTSGKIDYIQFEKKGKVLYGESDVKKLLEKHYHKAWDCELHRR